VAEGFGPFRDFQFIKDSLFDQNLNYSSKPFDDTADYIFKRKELENWLCLQMRLLSGYSGEFRRAFRFVSGSHSAPNQAAS